MKPSILHVAAFANPSGGGFVAALARLARDPRLETALLVPRASEHFAWTRRLADAGVALRYASTPIDAVTVIAKNAPTVVHAHFVEWMLPATLGAKAAGARVAWHLHSGVAPQLGRRELARRVKYAAARRLVERFFCVSSDLVEYLERYGVSRDRIEELPNGIDLERYRPPTLRDRAASRQRFGIAPKDRVAVFFGRDAFVKGADRLALALAHMPSQPVIIAIAASRETLYALGESRVVDAGTLLDVRDALYAADAIVLPSRSEGVPYSLLEARACGLPAVASPLPGIVRALDDDGGTTFVDADDAQAFADAIDDATRAGVLPLDEIVARSISLDAWAESLATWYLAEAAA